jgi:glycosyltransferase involved in cell wall biosynthesis
LYHHGRICEDCKGGKFYSAILNNCCKHSFAVSAVSALEAYVHSWKNIWKKNISAFLFESRFMMQETEKFWGKDTVRLEFLGKPFPAKQFQAVFNDKGYVLYAGRLSNEKGVDILLQAMKENPEIPLKIAGDGEDAGRLKALSQKIELHNVEFLGPLYGDGFRELIEGARFLVVPSVWHENFPYVMMEAFASGKAVIGSDKGGIPEYIDPGKTGFIYPSEDPKALAACIRRLFNETGLARQMGVNAKAHADENFTDEIFFLRLSAIYQKVAGKLGKKHEFSP